MALDLVCAGLELSFLFCEKKALPKARAGWGVLADVLPCFDAAVPPVSSHTNDPEPTGTVPVGVGRFVCWSERSCTGFVVSNPIACLRH